MTTRPNGASAAADAVGPALAAGFPADLRQVRLLAEHLPQLVWTCLPDGRCDFLNHQWVDYTGVPEADHHGFAWVSAIHPDDRDRTWALWQAFMAGRADYDLEYRLRRHDGAYRWFKTRGLLLRAPDGSILRVFGTTTDINEQKRTEAELRESRERLEAALAASGTGTFRWDLRTNALDWDAELDLLFGLPPGQTVRSLERFVERAHPDDRAGIVERCRRCRDEGADFAMEFRVVLPDGTVRWLDDRGRTFVGADGRPAYVTGACVDITDRKRAEAEIRRLAEERRLALDAAGLGSWHLDPETGELATDRRLREIYGVTAERLNYEAALTLVHPDDQARVRAAVAAATRPDAPRPYSNEHRVIRPDGTVRWVHSVGRAHFTGQGAARRLTSVDGILADITDRKRTEERLRESEERSAFVRKSSGVGFWYCDLPFDVLEWDALVKAHFHLPPDARVTIDTFYERLHPDDREPTRRAIEQSIRDRAPYDVDYRTVDPATGAEKWVRAIGRTAYAADGKPFRFDGVTLDVTDRKRAEAALQEADRRKDEFLATLAHELRNPLAPIRTGLHVLRLTANDPTTTAATRGMMERQLGHMVRLIDDLLDVSRISRNKMNLRRGRVLLQEAVSVAVETARPAIEAAGHEFAVAVPPEPVYLDADLTRLAQVFANLLTNSAKYTECGGRVWLTARRDGGTVEVTVGDTGIGIPAAALPIVFDMFSQVDRSIERATGGLGIGLALVKGLVEMHGGTVTAASDGPGRGSTFTVRLPAPPIPAGPVGAPATDGSPARGPGRRVLIADDNRDAAAAMADLLGLLGHEVRAAHDGVAAVEAAEAFRPDVILMDVGMPRLNGYEATRRIRERPWGRAVTVVALTGWGQDGDRRSSREAGCDGHLVKPVGLADLEPYLTAAAS
jgi:PAS domain S-box-containing protein